MGDEVIDVLAVCRGSGWTEARITALRNTCAAAAAKETMAPGDRAWASAVAAALSGRAPGISPADMQRLADAELLM